MRNREQYQDFLKCLNMFTEDIITKHELQSLVSDALNRHPDLQVGPCSCICRCHDGTSACMAIQTPCCNCLLFGTLNMHSDLELRASYCSFPSTDLVNSRAAQMPARARVPLACTF